VGLDQRLAFLRRADFADLPQVAACHGDRLLAGHPFGNCPAEQSNESRPDSPRQHRVTMGILQGCFPGLIRRRHDRDGGVYAANGQAVAAEQFHAVVELRVEERQARHVDFRPDAAQVDPRKSMGRRRADDLGEAPIRADQGGEAQLHGRNANH
jgi:hypothetical protein